MSESEKYRYDFKSKKPRHILQREEMVELIFEMICTLTEERDEVKFEEIKRDWNEKAAAAARRG